MKAFKFGLKYYRPLFVPMMICHIMGWIAITLGQSLPMLSGFIIDGIINYEGVPPLESGGFYTFLHTGVFGDYGTMDLLVNTAILFVSVSFVRTLIFYIRNNWHIRNGFRIEAGMRDDTYAKLLRLSNRSLGHYNTGELLTVMNADICSAKELYTTDMLVISDVVFRMLYDVVMLITINAYLLIIPILVVPVFVIALRRYLVAAKTVSENIRSRGSDLNTTVTENINAVRIVKAYTNEDYEIEKFEKRNEALKQSYFAHTITTSKFNAIFGTLRQIAYVGTVVVCTLLILNGYLKAGSLVACTAYVMMIMSDITTFNSYTFIFQQHAVSLDKVRIFMEEEEIEKEHKATAVIEDTDITVEHMSVMADGKYLLRDINLELPYGKKLGIMGVTGSGKSVLVKALSYIVPYTEGSIKLSGKDIKEFDIEELRSQFSYVFQDVFLFSNTIDANIAFSRPTAHTWEIHRAARFAMADDFISKMPQGYETIVGEKGVGLSGGQRQRVSIARAIIKNAPVLILDDATSALDTVTERELLKNIKREFPQKTLVIASHKVSAVKDCDEIIYLVDGEIKERGSFDELVAMDGIFADVYHKQMEQRIEGGDS